ncbi:MAG: tol-pal system YbgF family protein, partial [Gemmatimonadales bacterium]
TLPAEKGGAEVLLLVARVQDGLGHAADAERGYRQVSELKVPASAAAAGFELGRLLVRGDRKDEAIAVLEQVLVSYPSSAVAPQARRLLDQAKGAIPPA